MEVVAHEEFAFVAEVQSRRTARVKRRDRQEAMRTLPSGFVHRHEHGHRRRVVAGAIKTRCRLRCRDAVQCVDDGAVREYEEARWEWQREQWSHHGDFRVAQVIGQVIRKVKRLPSGQQEVQRRTILQFDGGEKRYLAML